MRSIGYGLCPPYAIALLFAAIATCLPMPASAQVRAKADVACKPTGTALQYDCTIALMNARTNEPLSGVTLTVGADMPSMPMMHNVRPVAAAPGDGPGTYRARILLEMHGDWALRLDLSGPLRDRVVVNLRFEPDRVAPAAASRAPARHKH
jgi:YtkA-like protein